MELSHLIYIFLNTEESNKVDADVIGKRRLEMYLLLQQLVGCLQSTRTFLMCSLRAPMNKRNRVIRQHL